MHSGDDIPQTARMASLRNVFLRYRARIADVMIPSDVRVVSDMLAVEALNLMQAAPHYLAAGSTGQPPNR